MSFSEIFELVLTILFCIACGVLTYFKVKGNITEAVAELIALAEQSGMCGKDKMASVVNTLYTKVPTVFKKFLTVETLEKLAQFIFDSMRKYADEYNKNKGEKKDATDK